MSGPSPCALSRPLGDQRRFRSRCVAPKPSSASPYGGCKPKPRKFHKPFHINLLCVNFDPSQSCQKSLNGPEPNLYNVRCVGYGDARGVAESPTCPARRGRVCNRSQDVACADGWEPGGPPVGRRALRSFVSHPASEVPGAHSRTHKAAFAGSRCNRRNAPFRPAQRMHRVDPVLTPGDIHQAWREIDWIPTQTHQFRYPQAVAIGNQEQG
jgi:hypothetical protein